LSLSAKEPTHPPMAMTTAKPNKRREILVFPTKRCAIRMAGAKVFPSTVPTQICRTRVKRTGCLGMRGRNRRGGNGTERSNGGCVLFNLSTDRADRRRSIPHRGCGTLAQAEPCATLRSTSGAAQTKNKSDYVQQQETT
jgi:hypothetical protein